MDQPGPSGSDEPNAKRRKENIENIENDENDHNAADDDTIAIAPGEEQTADIFKLDIDCFEEAFDYLPLEDLVSVGKTCKRLQQVAGHCFQQNYSGKTVHITKEGVYFNIMNRTGEIKYYLQHFAPFIQRISIDDEYGLQYFVGAQSKFGRLRQIEFRNLKSSDMDRLKKISMGKFEKLFFEDSELSNDFYEIIDQCTKLKRLEISGCKCESKWLNRKYPTLESFAFYSRTENFIEGIPAFLELNPNIQKFETNALFLWEQRHTMMAANIKLDDLVIFNNFESIYDLLNELHASGFYQKLILYYQNKLNQEGIDRLTSLNGLNKLILSARDTSSLTFSALNNIEELHMYRKDFIVDIDNLPNDLTNLKRVYFVYTSFDAITLFIRQSVEMHTIRVDYLRTGVHFNRDTGIIDLPALNRERALLSLKQLDAVQKLTLYVNDRIYLATKWTFGETDFGLVRIKRKTLLPTKKRGKRT